MRLIAVGILLITLIGAFLRPLIALEEIVIFNQTKLEERLKNCENKNKPMLHCDGKCQLIKKISTDQTTSNKTNKIKHKLPNFDFVEAKFSEIQLNTQNSIHSNSKIIITSDVLTQSRIITPLTPPPLKLS